METAAGHLEYAPPPPVTRRRRVLRRRVAVLLVLAAVTWAAIQFGAPIYHNLGHLRRQRAAVGHVPPAGRLVSEARRGPPPYHRGGSGTAYSVTSQAPRPWGEFVAAAQVPASRVAFLGELRNRSGRRIVVVSGQFTYRPPPSITTLPAAARPPIGDHRVALSAYVLRPGGVRASPALLGNLGALGIDLRASAPVRLFAGRPDPNDASRFTIEYQHGQTRGIIDGQLRDDETVDLTVRNQPAAAPGG